MPKSISVEFQNLLDNIEQTEHLTASEKVWAKSLVEVAYAIGSRDGFKEAGELALKEFNQ